MRRKAARKANSAQPTRSGGAKPGASWRNLGFFLVLGLAYSAWEYVETGSVQWPSRLLGQGGSTVDVVNTIGEAREGRAPAGIDLTGRVVRVADGDTISVLDRNNQQHKIRFFGIDSPERDQPHGQEARQALTRMVDEQQVGVAIVEIDDYGRTVGTVYRGDTNINLALVEGGHAWWYRYHAPHERHLEAAEKDARDAGRGLWAAQKPIAPWDWRRGRR